MRRVLGLERILSAFAGFSFGIFVTIATTWLASLQISMALGAIALVLSLLLAVAWLYVGSRNTNQIDVPLQTPLRLDSDLARERHARQAYIGFVPLFTPQKPSPALDLTRTELLDAVNNLDFDKLHMEISNFKPTIAALLVHKHKLNHVWLLTTSPKTNSESELPGSFSYAKLLAEYMCQRHDMATVQFHFGVRQNISMEEDSLVMALTYQCVQVAFADAISLDIPAHEVVADISTGFRSMVLGMVLACLDKDRDLEFMGTHYGLNGSPTGPLYPIIYPFEVHERTEAN